MGLYLALSPEDARPQWLLYVIIIAAAFFRIREYPGATEGGRDIRDLIRDRTVLLVRDPELRKFLAARTLMVSTALVGPVYVSRAQQAAGQTLDGLGWLVIASGLAAALSSSLWGLRSDKSSWSTMGLAAGLAGALGMAVLGMLNLAPRLSDSIAFYAAVLFVLGIAHAGVRIGRKTHVVDHASGDRKAEYVALGNTIVGVLLIVIGALVSVLVALGLEIAVAVLSILAFLGAVTSLTLKDVQTPG